MELSELKLVSAANLIRLRTEAGMTQAELGALLNYSDKSISKWERGEAIPDAYVLTQIAAIFHVNVDYLLSSHDAWEPPPDPEEENRIAYNINTIIAISLIGVFTVILTVFVTLWILGIIEWRVFLIGFVVEMLLYLVLDCVFKKAHHLRVNLCIFVSSLFVLTFTYLGHWQILILILPALILVNLGCNMRSRPKKHPAKPKTSNAAETAKTEK